MDNMIIIERDDGSDSLVEISANGEFICHSDRIGKLVKDYGKLEAENKYLKTSIAKHEAILAWLTNGNNDDVELKYDMEMIKYKKPEKNLEAENKLLKESHHEIYEIYAGSESMVSETAAEQYWIDKCKEMADIASKLKGK